MRKLGVRWCLEFLPEFHRCVGWIALAPSADDNENQRFLRQINGFVILGADSLSCPSLPIHDFSVSFCNCLCVSALASVQKQGPRLACRIERRHCAAAQPLDQLRKIGLQPSALLRVEGGVIRNFRNRICHRGEGALTQECASAIASIMQGSRIQAYLCRNYAETH